jgi:hypothetical protein
MNEEVKFIRGNDCINRLAQRPDIAAEVAVTLAAAVPGNRDTTVTFRTVRVHTIAVHDCHSWRIGLDLFANLLVGFHTSS